MKLRRGRLRRCPILFCFLGLLVLLGGALSGFGFALTGYTWPSGTQISMHLQLTRASGALQDGSADWNASAADALSNWNQYIDTVKFVAAAPTGSSGTDGANEVLFSSTVYGDAWPTTALAVTLKMSSQGSSLTEIDVLFNDNVKWDSYRGPIQGGGPSGTYDFHRVALHEFGHVLGLDHPDQHGQTVVAQMNSIISDLDALADDDIAGAQSLYAVRITSSLTPPNVTVANNFSYQITANNHPTSFDATGLPPGLQLDSATGLISGAPTASGPFSVTVTAHGTPKDASAQVRIVVLGPTITNPFLLNADVGRDYSYQVIASHYPATFDAAGLPPGLSIDPGSGRITGVPTAVGTFSVTLIAHTLYGDAAAIAPLVVLAPRITGVIPLTPVEVGGALNCQVSATGGPTNFGATGLPDGLQIDPQTGIISGVPTLSGTYQVTILANTPYGTATSTITMRITPASAGDTPVARFPMTSLTALVADPQRSRIYAATFQGLTVIDVPSLSIIKTIVLSTPWDISVSRDGTRLWMATKSTTVGVVDLDKLEVLPSLTIGVPAERIREGFDHHLLVSGSGGDAFEIDPSAGTVVRFNPEIHGYASHCALETSPDGKTLYVGNLVDVDPMLARYDISGGAPVLLQSIPLSTSGNGAFLSVSHGGQAVSYGTAATTPLRSGADLSVTLTTLSLGASAGQLVFSGDDSLAFEAVRANAGLSDPGTIGVFSVQNGQRVRTITLPAGVTAERMAIDRDNSYLFAYAASSFLSLPELRVYPVSVSTRTVVPVPKSLLNVSTRLRAQPGDNALIGGFIIKGTQAKKIALRAMGPSLPVPGKLADPALQLYDSTGALMAQNDNWNAHRYDVMATGLPPGDEHEAVIIATLPPGAYTAVVRGVNDSSGVALVEAYDLSADSDSKLGNISTRGRVEAGDNVMIGGFIIGGGQPTSVVVRAIGPSLGNFGVTDALGDPTLEVHDGNGGLVAEDDDWRQFQDQILTQTGLAPSDDRESAMFLVLQPGAYTAVVRGKNNGAGVGLVEVYNLDAN